ncbi:MAG: cache domain-containing protein [Planctomycetales bacterium]|nr:cache domain-containing protein [bacterium]UNM07145.1 MAG: cache domain-containing protein [Planctomycetales bacterium]
MSFTAALADIESKGGKPSRTGQVPRILAVLLTILIIFIGWTFFWLAQSNRDALLSAREDEIVDGADAAVTILSGIERKEREGLLSNRQAKQTALDLMKDLRFGPFGNGFVYVLDRNGVMLMHPLSSDLVGEDVSPLSDAYGTRFIAQLMKLYFREDASFVEYEMDWAGEGGMAVPRLAYATVFAEYDWVVVADAPLDDIELAVDEQIQKQWLVVAVMCIVLGVIITITLKRLLLTRVDELIKVSHAIAAGDYSARVDNPQTSELATLCEAINQMAQGIQERDASISLSQRTAVFALAKLAEARDNETGGHLLRVREYATLLATKLSGREGWKEIIDEQFIRDIYDAVMLHDIGKVGIPDVILLKPASLDDHERAIMMSHTLIGANTIRAARQQMQVESGFLTMAEEIARSHHERWDGQGYVEMLKGRDIPAAARIFSVADVYDALTTSRPYKPAYSHEDTVEMMTADRGKRFDPDVLDSFLASAGEFNRIRLEFAAK